MAPKVLWIDERLSAVPMLALVAALLPDMLVSDMLIELTVGRVCIAAAIAGVRIFVALF